MPLYTTVRLLVYHLSVIWAHTSHLSKTPRRKIFVMVAMYESNIVVSVSNLESYRYRLLCTVYNDECLASSAVFPEYMYVVENLWGICLRLLHLRAIRHSWLLVLMVNLGPAPFEE